jgi:fimbrial isopeptide formation D2 family protein/uncharacterized repeat protein (TIGR01451 family)
LTFTDPGNPADPNDPSGTATVLDPTDDTTVEVVEPSLQVTKTVEVPSTGDTEGDAGDAATYVITVVHTGASTADAFDVKLSDPLPAEFDPTGVTALIGATDVSSFFTVSGDLLVTDPALDLAMGEMLTVRINGTLDGNFTDADGNTIEAGETVPNTATLTWSTRANSQPGDVDQTGLSSYITDGTDSERGDAADLAADVNTATDDALFTVPGPEIDKKFTDPNQGDPTIGEFVEYDLIVTVPEGTTQDLVLSDDIPVGMGFVSATLITQAAASVHLSDDFNGTVSFTGTDVTTTGLNGADVSLDLGDVTAAATSGTADNAFVIRLRALVLDVPGNDGLLPGQTDLANSASLTFTDPGNPADPNDPSGTATVLDPTDDTTVEVVEPNLVVEKDVDILGNNYGIAEDPVSYTILVRHNASGDAGEDSTADAHDVLVTDTLPFEFVPAAFTATLSGTGDIASNFELSGQSFSTLTPFTIPLDQSVTIEITGTINSSATTATFVDNVADIEWGSVAGDGVDSPYIDDGTDTERGDGIDHDAGIYTDSDDAEFSIPEFDKAVAATSLADTGSTQHTAAVDAAIGEIVTYRLSATLPNGAPVPTVISDTMPSNLQIISTSVVSIGGNTTLGQTAGGDISGSGLAIGAPGTVSGGTVVFDFGTLTVADDDQVDEGANRIVVEIQTAVLNDGANEDGQTKSNSASFDFNGSEPLSDSENVDVVEPDIELTKTFYDDANAVEVAQVDAGDTVTVRFRVSNTGTGPLNDAEITDTLDPFFDASTAAVVGSTANGFSFSLSADEVRFSGGVLQPGDVVDLAFSVVVGQSVNPNDSVSNSATVAGDSLPGGHPNNGNPAFDRPYTDEDSDDLVVPNLQIAKAFVVSDNPDTPDMPVDGSPDLNIGEIATFHFLVTLPEGTSPGLQFVDLLPDGMQYVDGTARLILDNTALSVASPLGDVSFNGSFEAASGGTLSNGDFIPLGDVNAASGDGNDIQVDFGQIVPVGQQGVVDRQFILEVQVVVLDEPVNQSGSELTNTSTLDVPGDGVDPVTSNAQVIEVVDPELLIEKRFFDASGTNEVEVVRGGSTLTVSVTLSNPGTGPVYDLEAQDPLNTAKFDIASIAPVSTPSGYTFAVAGNTVIYSGDGPIMPGDSVDFRYTVKVKNGFSDAENTAFVTAGDTVPGDSEHQRDHSGAQATDTIREFVEPRRPPGLPSAAPPFGDVDDGSGGRSPDDILASFRYDVMDLRRGEIDELLLRLREDIQRVLPKPDISYMATGITAQGANVRMLIFDATGALVGDTSVVADAGGNWLVSFPSVVLKDQPYRVEVQITLAEYTQGTIGAFNTNTYYTPVQDARHFVYKTLSVDGVIAEKADASLNDQSDELFNPLGRELDNWNVPPSFLATTNTESL